MAIKLFDMDEAVYAEWVASRPEVVRRIAEGIRPNFLYRLKSTGQYVTLYSICENGTVTVDVTSEFNKNLDFERHVFGVDPNDLEEATELPEGGPPMLNSEEEIREYCDMLRTKLYKRKS